MEALRSPQERVEKYSKWLAQYQLLLLHPSPGGNGGDAAAASHRSIEVSEQPCGWVVSGLVMSSTCLVAVVTHLLSHIHIHTDPGPVRHGRGRRPHAPAPARAAYAAGPGGPAGAHAR